MLGARQSGFRSGLQNLRVLARRGDDRRRPRGRGGRPGRRSGPRRAPAPRRGGGRVGAFGTVWLHGEVMSARSGDPGGMTRIIGGTAGGRRIAAPRGAATRPTTDRVREALFSAIESWCGSLSGLRFLDLYAGSGAVGLEAWSRGAGVVSLVEQDRRTAAPHRVQRRVAGLPQGRRPGLVGVRHAAAGTRPRRTTWRTSTRPTPSPTRPSWPTSRRCSGTAGSSRARWSWSSARPGGTASPGRRATRPARTRPTATARCGSRHAAVAAEADD